MIRTQAAESLGPALGSPDFIIKAHGRWLYRYERISNNIHFRALGFVDYAKIGDLVVCSELHLFGLSVYSRLDDRRCVLGVNFGG